MSYRITWIWLTCFALFISGLSYGGTFEITNQSESEYRDSDVCTSAERHAAYEASKRCESVGIASYERVSDWMKKEWSIDFPGHLYDFGYTKYYCEVTAEFKCLK